jgi:hypothetical protein
VPRRTRSPLRSPAILLLAALVLGNALLRGGVDLPVVAASAVLAAAALATTVRWRRRSSDPAAEDGRAALPLLVPGLALVTAAIALQLVPLPPGVIRALSPAAADLFARHLGPLGAWPAARPLSLDPGTTAFELAQACTWTAVAAAAALAAADRARRDALLRIVAASGPVVVAAVYGARLAGRGALLDPRFPFVNPNHLAGFLQLAAWPALGFALRERGPARVGWLAAFAFTGSGILLSLSRGGIGAFVVGGGVFAALWLRAGRRRHDASDPRPPPRWAELWRRDKRALVREAMARSALVIPVAVSAALGLAAFVAFDRIVTELRTVTEASSTEVKLGLWPSALQVIRDHPLVGIGRGAFASVFPAYKWEPIPATFTHVENEWLQLPVDLGLAFGVLAIALFAWTWLAQARRSELSRPVIGALAGTAALVVHNAFDFALEIGGVAIPFAVVMGVLSRELPAVRAPAWLVRACAGLGLAVAALAILVHHGHRLEVDAARVATAPDADAALAAAREVLPWHPADWVPPAAVGTKLAGVLRCDEAEPWLRRAMERDPTAPEPQRSAALCWALRGQGTLAKRSYRLAFTLGDAGALTEAHQLFPGKGELLEIAPDSPAGLRAAAAVLQKDAPDEAREAYRRGWESFGDTSALAGLARLTIEGDDAAAALPLARALEVAAPLEPAGWALAARALEAAGDAEGAVGELTAGLARLPGRIELLEPLGGVHLRARRWSQARAAFEQIVARVDRVAARKKVLVARALEGQERYGEALRMLADARDIAPDDPTPLEAFARVAAKAGRYDEALQALEAAGRKPGVAPGRYAAEVERIRTAKTAALVRRAGAAAPQDGGPAAP